MYWPLKNLQVELSPLQIPQASGEALEPRIWSQPTACMQKKKKISVDSTTTIKSISREINFTTPTQIIVLQETGMFQVFAFKTQIQNHISEVVQNGENIMAEHSLILHVT